MTIHGVPASEVSAAGRRTDNPASNNEQLAGEALGLYFELNPSMRSVLPPGPARAELLEHSRDGLTRQEFNHIFRRRMTRAAWNAFLLRGSNGEGEGRIENLNDLVLFFTAFQDYSEATGRQVSFSYFSTCDRITTAPPLADAILRMDEPQREIFIRELVLSNADIVIPFLSYVQMSIPPRSQVSPEDYTRAVERALETLIRQASHPGNRQGARSREHLELFGAVLFHHVNQAAANRETRCRLDRLDFSRPQVAERAFRDFVFPFFTQHAYPAAAVSDEALAPEQGVETLSVAERAEAASGSGSAEPEDGPYLQGDVIRQNYDGLVEFVEQFESLVSLVGDNCFIRAENGRAIRLNDLDPGSDIFQEALRLASERGADRAAVLTQLREAPLLQAIVPQETEGYATPSDVPRRITEVAVEDVIAQNTSVETSDVQLDVDPPATPSVYHLVEVDEAPIDPDAPPELELTSSRYQATYRPTLF